MSENIASLDAEQAVICSLLLNIKSLGKISDKINYKDFYYQPHQEMFKAITYLFSKGESVDLITVKDRLESTNRLALVGVSYLSEVANAVPTSTFIVDHAKIIKDKALRREAIEVVKNMQNSLQDEKINIKDTITDVVASITNLVKKNRKKDGSIKEVLGEALTEWEKAKDYGLGLLTGINQLDNAIHGYRPGHYWVILAGTNVGKTAFTTMLLEKFLTLHPKECVVFFSAEMTSQDIAGKLIAQRVREDFYDLISKTETPEVIKAVEWLQDKKLFVYDTIRTPAEISVQLNLLRMQGYNPSVVFVDYIQNLHGKGDSYERITNLTINLQGIALQHSLCLVALSQVPGDDQKGDDGITVNGKGSKDIDNTASFALRVVRDIKHELENPENNPHIAEVQIRKNRHGRKGRFEILFDEPKGLFLLKDEMGEMGQRAPKGMSADQIANMFDAQIK